MGVALPGHEVWLENCLPPKSIERSRRQLEQVHHPAQNFFSTVECDWCWARTFFGDTTSCRNGNRSRTAVHNRRNSRNRKPPRGSKYATDPLTLIAATISDRSRTL